MAEKVNKSTAHYVYAADYWGAKFCEDCTMYRPTGRRMGRCTKVVGIVEDGGHCDFFERRRGSDGGA